MTKRTPALLAGVVSLVLFSGPAFAGDDVKGQIESVNKGNQSFVVNGTEFFVTPSTEFEDGLKGFDDLKPGLRVEVDYHQRDGKRFAKEVELD
ncbi:MAG: DUF1344 domain-containing protein [Burkholderiales bacterium]|nr:DUF1344 domain-containing protein [Burkholderiales bacterium]